MLLPWNPMRSSVLTSSIVHFGRKPGEQATRNPVQPPELLDKIDERQGGFLFNYCAQICSVVFLLLPLCVCLVASSSQRGSGLSRLSVFFS